MAIPFSIFGLMLGLYLTNNPISFFASLGFFALIGLSIKNTILLTDFANQARASGLSAVDSAAAAVKERFRPLVATSLTAIFSLIPLALTSPFWQGLAVVLIFGLASSTILVLLVFPYFYLGVEYLRVHINRRWGLSWLSTTLAAAFIIGKYVDPVFGLLLFGVSLLALLIWALLQKPRFTINK
jgi:HAE1 family hydrophobic/amphiphilic exporter-1